MSKSFYRLIFLLILAAILFKLFNHFKTSPSYGTVIILNGPSAAGKSSIQKEFQHLMMPNLWIKVGIDNLFDKPMPDITPENMQFWQSPNSIRWIEMNKDEKGNTVIPLFIGAQGDKVAYGMNSAIAAYAKNGCNVIVDYIAYKKEWLDDLHKQLKDIQTIWVKVAAPLEILEQREASRDTSPKGHARSHYDIIYWNAHYDLEVDSAKKKAQEIAQEIKNYLHVNA